MSAIRTFRDLVDAKGEDALCRATGLTPSAIRLWKHRNKISRENWPELQLAFEDIDLALLLRLEKSSVLGGAA